MLCIAAYNSASLYPKCSISLAICAQGNSLQLQLAAFFNGLDEGECTVYCVHQGFLILAI